MKQPLEPFVPEDRSVRWAMADAWYDRVGIEAWAGGDVPWRATSSNPAARQHARVVTRLFVEMEASGILAADERLVVLEVGAGQGGFCAAFLGALDRDCGGDGRRLRDRLRYVICDRSEACVRGAASHERLAAHVAAGRVEAAVLDVRRPRELRALDGGPLAITPAVAIANYLCCVVPPLVLQRDGESWRERLTSLHADVEGTPEEALRGYFEDPAGSALLREATPETRWVEIVLGARFAGSDHPAILEAAVNRLPQATLVYPRPFMELVDALAALMKPGGLMMVSDYGRCDRRDLAGHRELTAQLYGNSPAYAVNFSIFDALARHRGWDVVRTRNPYRSLHSAAIRFLPRMSTAFRGAYHRNFVREEPGEDLSDFRDCGRAAYEGGRYLTAIRFYRRALRLDPDNAALRYLQGEACLEGGYLEAAYGHLVRGLRVGPAEDEDFEFLLGRVCHAMGRDREAVAWYHESLRREPHPVTHANLGAILLELGDHREAYRQLSAALALRPEYPRAADLLTRTRDQWIARLLADE